MRIEQIDEGVGRIVKGVNTTVDVGTNQTSIEAAKFGFKVDKDGKPPTLSTKVKGKSTNVLFNLGMAESKYTDMEHAVMEGGHSLDDLDKPTPSVYDISKKHDVTISHVLDQLRMGIQAEYEHTSDFDVAKEIALDHVAEDPNYYDHLKFIELEEALGEIAQSTEIYVDMDGVLADFFGEWKKLIGQDWRNIDDIDSALQKIRDTENFWLDLPLTNNARPLLELIRKVKGSYSILSSPLPNDPNSEPHKREWIKNNLRFFMPSQVIITHDKAKYAKQSDGTPNILIDDYGVNIGKWEAAGGIGFKYKDHKFERTANAIRQHMQEPVEEKFASDAQRRAAFASGYKPKGKKKK